ncbi:thiol:disulfide interchange protein DsbA/DsbL [Campylobacter sp. MIT 21-1685]|uniref:thiol:disulfide interchange protein DsbA/DsbL n=1 Tax=unclassified Campylobacter TaxID=2593542 RepID=UPI00224B4C13|nr:MULTISPECIES: thiol:disulfide interchange protein DsbA/DsbL [unclassified Campylobacter]MCX2682957.1 thiol:disulfide interchange protein DsbA/DsbL [Campylobacter sp. MIT 21-1684]MCX2751239.1 thiol:disulfide interchange protein DsbA/DsbL [Campylobacter sp. MIT 21-1682]MCX2807438.1 thiol:disulfide interchange protein DsbA/DsbL [Campylobacter sp. MIT 21-1685]
MFLQKISTLYLLFIFANFAFAEDFIKLENPIAHSKNTVIEAFSYKCIHCYNHHKFGTLEKLRAKFPNLHYEIYPVSLMNGKFAKEINDLFAYANFKDSQENKDASYEESFSYKLADAYFVSYFINKQEFRNLDELYEMSLKILQNEKKELDRFLENKEAKEILSRFQRVNDIAKTYGTPAFVVNGIYQIKPEALSSMDALEKLVERLSQK